METIREKIIKALKEHGRLATSRAGAIVGISHGQALEVMQGMWETGEIIGEVETNATYWSLAKTKTTRGGEVKTLSSLKEKKQ